MHKSIFTLKSIKLVQNKLPYYFKFNATGGRQLTRKTHFSMNPWLRYLKLIQIPHQIKFIQSDIQTLNLSLSEYKKNISNQHIKLLKNAF